MDSLVADESWLELARILLAGFDSVVTTIAAQPFLLSRFDGDQLRNHVPRLLPRTVSDVVMVVGVKPRHRLDDPEVRAVFRWTEQMVVTHGWGFEVWSGVDAWCPVLPELHVVSFRTSAARSPGRGSLRRR
jgi:hypothetical protein